MTHPKKNPPTGYGGLSAYANHRRRHGLSGKAVSSVHKAVQEGRLSKPDSKTGWLCFEAADKEWETTTSNQKAGAASSLYMRDLKTGEDGRPNVDPLPVSIGMRVLADYERQRRLQVDRQVREGKLMWRTDAEESVRVYFEALRDKLMNVPDQVSIQLGGNVRERRRVADIITGELRALLQEPAMVKP